PFPLPDPPPQEEGLWHWSETTQAIPSPVARVIRAHSGARLRRCLVSPGCGLRPYPGYESGKASAFASAGGRLCCTSLDCRLGVPGKGRRQEQFRHPLRGCRVTFSLLVQRSALQQPNG